MKIVCLGECMIELSGEPLQRRYGGDTLNTAVYMARLLKHTTHQIHYLSALGTDALSQEMIDAWQAEGVYTDHVVRLPQALPGLYLVQTDSKGERSFHYWRNDSAAKRYFSGSSDLIQKLIPNDAQALYVSGISLALFPINQRQQFIQAMDNFKKNGGQIWFDNNYRPNMINKDEAIQAHEAVIALADIALLTMEDEILLYGSHTPDDVISRVHQLGCTELVIKRGSEPALLSHNGVRTEVAAQPVNNVVDTCAAGDSFAAGYLAGRVMMMPPEQSAAQAHRLSSVVIQYSGAIIAADLVPVL